MHTSVSLSSVTLLHCSPTTIKTPWRCMGTTDLRKGVTSMATPAMCMTSRTTRKVITEGQPCRQGSLEMSPSRHTLKGRVPVIMATIVLDQITRCGCVPVSGPGMPRYLQVCSAAPGSVTLEQQRCKCCSPVACLCISCWRAALIRYVPQHLPVVCQPEHNAEAPLSQRGRFGRA